MTTAAPTGSPTLELAPGEALASRDDLFTRALLVVAAGRVAVQAASSGIVMWFETGDLLVFAGLPGARVYNPGRQPAQITLVARR